ncbi:type VI secretion system tip protein VgrG, partial [Acinetobacter baumannii]
VLFDPDPRNPWDEASDFKRKVEWPNQNDVEGSIGIESGSKGLTETLKNDFKKLSQLASNVKSVQQKIESVKKIKDQGAKALLPMAMEQVLGGSDGSKLSQSFVSQNSFMPSSQQSNPLRR